MSSIRCRSFSIIAAIASFLAVSAAFLSLSASVRILFIFSALLSFTAAAVFAWFAFTFKVLSKELKQLKTKHADMSSPEESNSELSSLGKEIAEVIGSAISQYSQKVEYLDQRLQSVRLQAQLSDRQKRNIEAIIYSIRDAVLVTDEYDRLIVANKAAGELFGFDPSESSLKPLTLLLALHGKNLADAVIKARLARSQHTRCEQEIINDSEKRTFDCIMSCVNDREKRVSGVVVVLHDITREKEVSQMKNDFIGHVSHELKTPLASITAYSEMLVDGEASDEETQKEFYKVIQSQAQRLNRLIEDILNVSRIESGLIKLNKERLSLAMLIEEQMDMIRGFAEEKNITVVCKRPIIFDQVFADKDMMSQVIVNLLSNAVKYTLSGGSVEVWTDVDDSSRLARVSVKDTGVGIPAEEIGHLFEKFYRVGANKKVAKGTGLGLNLVKQIVEKVHGGRVFVESEVGKGSTFGFELPLAGADVAQVI